MTVNDKFQTKYHLLFKQIEQRILSGALLSGEPIPSIRRLIVENKVSRPTVEKGLELLEKRGLIKCHPKRGYFIIDRKSSPVAINHIAFLTALLDDDAKNYAKGVTETLDHEKYTSSIFSSHADLGKFQQILNQVAQLKPSGIILHTMSDELCQFEVSLLIESGIPIVAIGPFQPDLVCDRVLVSEHSLIDKLVQYILKHRLRNLAAFADSLQNREFLTKVLNDRLTDSILNLPDERVFMIDNSPGYSDHPDPYIATELKMTELLKNGFNEGTLICGHDYPAVGALRAILKAKIKVPEQIKIISTTRCAVNGASPMQITTIDPHNAEKAHIATNLLTRRIEGYTGPPEVHYVAGELIEGETT